MKRGTESRVFLGKDTSIDEFSGLNVLSTVLLGKKEGGFQDHGGLYIVNNVTLGKGIAHIIAQVVFGVPPLSLPNAVSAAIPSLTAFGGTEQRNLPEGYIQRNFIYMMDGSYLLTDIVPTYDCKIEMDFQTTSFPGSGSSFIGARSGGPGDGLNLGRSVSNYVQFDGFDGNRYTSSTGQFATNTRYKYVWNNQVATLYQGTTTVDTKTFTSTGTTTHSLAINGLNNSGSVVGNIAGIYLYSFKMWNAQGELIADYVPAQNANNEVGFYDMVTGTFMTATAGTFAAGTEAVPTPDAPMDIVCNNGVLKYGQYGKNLFNYDQEPTIESVSSGGVWARYNISIDLSVGNWYAKHIANVQPGTYIASVYTANGLVNFGNIFVYNGITATKYSSGSAITITTPSELWFIGGSASTWTTITKVQVESGSTVTDWEEYHFGVYTDGTVETIQVSGNLVDFNETRINQDTWAAADKTKGFEVEAAVYSKTIGSFIFNNANCFGAFVPCKLGKSVSIDFFDYTPYYGRCFYCEVDADGKATTAPALYASDSVITQKTFTLTQANSIGFVFEWYLNAAQTRDYTKENYTIVAGTTPPTQYIPFNISTATCEDLLGLNPAYTELEYIQTTGTQYIDTDIKPDEDYDIEVVFTTPDTLGNGALFGNQSADVLLYLSSNAFNVYNSNSNKGNLTPTVSTNTKYSAKLSVVGTNATVSGDFSGTFSNLTITGTRNILVGANFSSYITDFGKFKYHSVRITKGGVLVRNLIPAKRNSDNASGMYDTVSETFFVNAGTGTFTDGAKIRKFGYAYQDNQDVISGGVTRKVGVKVLDGTEGWQLNNNRFRVQGLIPASESNAMVCSHFAFTGNLTTDNTIYRAPDSSWLQIRYDTANNDVTTFTNFLSQQYAAGTPIIVVYALATSTTETVTGQPMATAEGDNTAEITQASMSGLELSVTYMKRP